MRILLCLFFILVSLEVSATLEIPVNMNAADRQRALEILGLGSGSKILGDPIPLGGFSGVEIGVQTVLIPVSDISLLGSGANKSEYLNYSLITLGKGLYNNIDIFLEFSPFQNAEDVSTVGGQVRWGVYQSDQFPTYLSLAVGVQSNNYQNKISTVATNADLVVGMRVHTSAIYMGFGMARATGNFLGSGPGTVDLGYDPHESVSSTHVLGGFSIKVDRIFLAMQADRYKDTVFSGKIGYRY